MDGVLEGGCDSVGVDGVGSTYGFVSTFRYEVAIVVVGVVAGLSVATEEFNPSSVFGGTSGGGQSSDNAWNTGAGESSGGGWGAGAGEAASGW